ncbi:hypothetical protein ACFO3O_07925 [Dokdonia ponticola]|uniref:DUF5673 domain-containing protein n=1 Tax=Dokdonia ponticola TaxID=2041041 RepID=A0ABV9HWF5_9FLAO
MDKIIVPAITMILVALVSSYLNKSIKKRVRSSLGGNFELKLHKLYWYMGISFISLGCVGFLAAGLTIKDGNEWVIGSAFLILFGGLGYISAIWYVNHSVHFNSNRIEAISVYKKGVSMNWSDITSIKFNPLTGLLIFTNAHGKKIKAHQHLVGLGELLRMIAVQTPWNVDDLKLPFKYPKHD